MFDKLTIRSRLMLAFGMLCGIVLLVACLAIAFLGRADERFVHYVHGINARATMAAHVRVAVDRRAIAARNLVLVRSSAEMQKEQAVVMKAHETVQKSLAELNRMIAEAQDASPKARQLVAEITRVEGIYGPLAQEIVSLAVQDRKDEAIRKMNDECRPLLATLSQLSDEYASLTEERAAHMVQAAEEASAVQRIWMVVACFFAFLAAAVSGWMIVRALHRSLGAEPALLSVATQAVAQGNLAPIPGAVHAPAGSVLASLGTMQESLSGIVSQVRQASDAIATGSSQIATGSADLSQRTEEQASALQQTSGTMEELKVTVHNNADNARRANELAAGANDVASLGGQVVSQVVSTMQDISASSKKIADIIAVIDGIAFQTNILALNAAVESARAGEQGRGFAVVANEVRTLAQRSASAAKEIKQLIGTSVDQVERGAGLVGDAGKTMEEIVRAINGVSTIVSEISLASTEQSSGVAQVGQAVTQIDLVTQQNAALVEESAAAAESLRCQAHRLVEIMGAFRLAV